MCLLSVTQLVNSKLLLKQLAAAVGGQGEEEIVEPEEEAPQETEKAE